MNGEFKYLFSPLRVGNITVKNRILQTAHQTNLNKKGTQVSDPYIEYLRERAKGGAGTIVTEIQSVHPTSDSFTGNICAFDENVIPSYKRLTEAVHEYDAKIFFLT